MAMVAMMKNEWPEASENIDILYHCYRQLKDNVNQISRE